MIHQTTDTNIDGDVIAIHETLVKLNWFTRLFFKPIWRETKREFLRNEEHTWNAGGSGVEIDSYKVYAVYERCVKSGMTRIREEYKLQW